MSKPMRRIAAVVATAAVSVALSGCTQGHWVYDAPPAAGVQADDGGIKLRNILVVSDSEGEAILLGGISSRDESTKVTGISIAAQKGDGEFATAQPVEFAQEIYKGRTIYLQGPTTRFTDPELNLGRLAAVTVSFSTGEQVSVEAPVMSSEHPDFKEAWTAASA